MPEFEMVDNWPNPEEDYQGDYDREDDWEETEEPLDYEIKFKAKGLTREELNSISRYLFEAIAKELEVPYEKLEELEIEED